MTRQGKRELLKAVRPRYLKANKKTKGRMLDEFVAATGYNRKYAITLLLHGPPQKSSKKKGSLIYGPESLRLWRKRGRLAGIYVAKRLHPFLPDLVDALERHGELSISAETKAKMLQMSLVFFSDISYQLESRIYI